MLAILAAPVLCLALAGPIMAATVPDYSLDRVYCASQAESGSDMIVIPKPVIYATDYNPGRLDYQWVTWRVWLYRQVGTSWTPVNASQDPNIGRWQPATLVHDKDIAERYMFSANTATFGIPVTRGANYRIAVQVYWAPGGSGSTVPVSQTSIWTWAGAHMNDNGFFGWGQYIPDACYYPVISGTVGLPSR